MGSCFSSGNTYTQLGAKDAFWQTVPLFKNLPLEFHPQLSECSESVSFDAGTILFRQGDPGLEFYVIKVGEALVERDTGAEVKKEGDYFGEGALLGNGFRRTTTMARTKLDCVMITKAKFEALGLHEKLEFPKREKVNRRFRMMAKGGAEDNESADMKEARKAQRARGSPGDVVQKPYLKVQFGCLKEIFLAPINVTAFILVPLGQYVSKQGYGEGPVFGVNFCAIIPLASILGQATEALSVHTGQLIGGLLNATFGNAVEMIMCIQAVRAGLISVVQGNLLGSILSNLLLVLGMATFASGIARHEQEFNAKGAASNMRCQLVASISVCLPTVFAAISPTEADEVVMISRICSFFLMGVYGMFLFFMLYTHNDFFAEEDAEEEEEDTLSPTFSCILLFCVTYVVFLASECLVDSIEEVSEQYGLSKAFIGIILLPIVGNAAEHSTAVTCAYKGMMDLALGVAVGSSTQIALFVVPCAIMFGWLFDQPMDLNFSVFEMVCLMLAVFLVSSVLSQGETNWLDGAMLMVVYALMATQTLFIAN